MKSLLVVLTVVASAVSAIPLADNPYQPRPAPYAPAPYQPRPYHEEPQYAPVELCPNYPYCDEAPHNIYHLQDEINLLRQRNQAIVALGEKLRYQEPNVPFVGGYQRY